MNELTQNTLSHLDKLIAFPTVSSESNMDLINYAANFFDDLGADVHLSHNPDGTKANLFASIGPRENGGVVLSGHTDVVPVEGQDWTSDPFSAVHKDDRVIGRGACDMKGFIACALASAPAFQALELTRPLHIALTYDEEVGCLGAPVMLNALADLGIRPNVAIIGEPTGMQIIEGHKGCYEYTTQIRGLEGHGSLPDAGVNAVESAVRIIHELLETGETLRQRAPVDSRFTPPWTTVSVGKIEGGIARNIIAKDCTFEWEIRPVQRSDSDLVWDRLHTLIDGSLLPEMQKRYEGAYIRTETAGEVDGLEPMSDSEATALVRELTGGNTTDVVSFGTEAGLFQNAGISTVVCGPGYIDQAHRPDEFVDVEQLNACLRMIERLKGKLSS